MNTQTTIEKMKQLRLTGMSDLYHRSLKEKNFPDYTTDELIALLIDTEWESKENRKIMGGKVPNHRDIFLMKPQIHAHAGDKEDLPQFVGPDEVADSDHHRAVFKRVADHQPKPRLVRQRDHLLGADH